MSTTRSPSRRRAEQRWSSAPVEERWGRPAPPAAGQAHAPGDSWARAADRAGSAGTSSVGAPVTRPPARTAPLADAPAPAQGQGALGPGRSEPAATGALAALHLMTALGLVRMLEGLSFLGPVVATLALTHLVAWSCRRWRVRAAPAALLGLVSVVLVSSWTVLPATTFFGVPGPATLHSALSHLSELPAQIRLYPVPAPFTQAFGLLITLGTGTAVIFADWAAFRARLTLEPLLAAFGLLILVDGLGTRQDRMVDAVGWAGCALAFVILGRRHGEARRTWGPDTTPEAAGMAEQGHRPVRPWLGGTVAAAVAALVAGSVVAPSIPGAHAGAMVRLDSAAPSATARTAFSPLVDIRSELLAPSPELAFTVRSPVPSYWQMTTLDHFDGERWTANQVYRATSGALSGKAAAPDIPGTSLVTQRFDLAGLDSTWLPAAARPVRVAGISGVAYDASAGSLLAPTAEPPGTEYSVVSALSNLTPSELESASEAAMPASVRADLQLPASIPGRVRRLAHQIVAKDVSAYSKALSLEEFFRHGFRYSLDVPPGNSTNAMVRFLFQTRAGFCQQFAGTYAVLARLVGLPTRVAVGFTAGQETSPGRYVVRALDAHAWPQVWMGRYGWVNFEPTPGRGEPGAASYTHVSPAQASVSGSGAAPPTIASRGNSSQALRGYAGHGGVAPTSGGTVRIRVSRQRPVPAGAKGRSAGTARSSTAKGAPASRRSWWWLVLAGLGAAAAVMAGTASFLRARRRRASAADRTAWAWEDATRALEAAGWPQRPSETPIAYARRVGAGLGPPARAALGELAEEMTRALFGVPGAVVADQGRLRHAVREVRAAGRLGLTPLARVVLRVDPRPALRLPKKPVPEPAPLGTREGALAGSSARA